MIVPALNEPAVVKVVNKIIRELPGAWIIVSYKNSDGSVPKIKRNKNITMIKQPGTGKGIACIQAFRHVKTEIACFIDADATYEPKDLRKVITLVRNGAAMALGDRLSLLDRNAMPAYVEFGNKMLTQTANLLYGMRINDSQTGLRAIRSSVFRSLHIREPQFGIEEEMNIKLAKKGLRIEQAPISYNIREGTSKQFKPVDGIKLLLIIFKFVSS